MWKQVRSTHMREFWAVSACRSMNKEIGMIGSTYITLLSVETQMMKMDGWLVGGWMKTDDISDIWHLQILVFILIYPCRVLASSQISTYHLWLCKSRPLKHRITNREKSPMFDWNLNWIEGIPSQIISISTFFTLSVGQSVHIHSLKQTQQQQQEQASLKVTNCGPASLI